MKTRRERDLDSFGVSGDDNNHTDQEWGKCRMIIIITTHKSEDWCPTLPTHPLIGERKKIVDDDNAV